MVELTLAWKLNWHHCCSRTHWWNTLFGSKVCFSFLIHGGKAAEYRPPIWSETDLISQSWWRGWWSLSQTTSSQRKCWESQTWKTFHHPSGHRWFCSSGSKLPWGCHGSHTALKWMKKDGCCWQHWGEDVTPNGTHRLYLWVTWATRCSFQERQKNKYSYWRERKPCSLLSLLLIPVGPAQKWGRWRKSLRALGNSCRTPGS